MGGGEDRERKEGREREREEGWEEKGRKTGRKERRKEDRFLNPKQNPRVGDKRKASKETRHHCKVDINDSSLSHTNKCMHLRTQKSQ